MQLKPSDVDAINHRLSVNGQVMEQEKQVNGNSATVAAVSESTNINCFKLWNMPMQPNGAIYRASSHKLEENKHGFSWIKITCQALFKCIQKSIMFYTLSKCTSQRN